jgi:hypothetical protein
MVEIKGAFRHIGLGKLVELFMSLRLSREPVVVACNVGWALKVTLETFDVYKIINRGFCFVMADSASNFFAIVRIFQEWLDI